MDELESNFLSRTQKLNEKRQTQLKQRMAKLLPELEKLFEEGKADEVDRLLETLVMPSSKEWGKNIHSLVRSSAEVGAIRAHLELLKLKESYEFDENDWSVDVREGRTSFNVNFPKEAQDYLKKYGYDIGVITDETVRERIREEVNKGLVNGIRGRDLKRNIDRVTETWVSQAHAETIARTETAKMYNAGRISRWLDPEQDGFVEALQYDAVVDTRTTDLCRNLDGKIISVGNSQAVAEFTPPNHYMCRATWLPVTKYESWADDFPTGEQPQKGFTFEPPLPKLIAKKPKKTPLVTPKSPVNPNKLTDPLVIRNLPDDEFRIAIGNITDLDMKYFLVKERAQLMAVQNGIVKRAVVKPDFAGTITEATGTLYASYGKISPVQFPLNGNTRRAVNNLIYDLEDAKNDWSAMEDILDNFIAKHGSNPEYMNVIIGLNKFKQQGLNAIEVSSKAYTVHQLSSDAEKALTIKRPPRRGHYKDAYGLHSAIDNGQEFLLKHVHEKLAPKNTGIKLKFDKDNMRAFARGSAGEMVFGKYEKDAGVIIHESAHIMHWNNKEVADLINTFFLRRTKNLTLPKTSRYGEDVIKDDFFSSYIGRLYGFENVKYIARDHTNNGVSMWGQEVFSMGLQEMYTDPQKFLEADPEHFYFTLALMEGLF